MSWTGVGTGFWTVLRSIFSTIQFLGTLYKGEDMAAHAVDFAEEYLGRRANQTRYTDLFVLLFSQYRHGLGKRNNQLAPTSKTILSQPSSRYSTVELAKVGNWRATRARTSSASIGGRPPTGRWACPTGAGTRVVCQLSRRGRTRASSRPASSRPASWPWSRSAPRRRGRVRGRSPSASRPWPGAPACRPGSRP